MMHCDHIAAYYKWLLGGVAGLDSKAYRQLEPLYWAYARATCDAGFAATFFRY